MLLSGLWLEERFTVDPGDYSVSPQYLRQILTKLHTRPWSNESAPNSSRWVYRLIKVRDSWGEITYKFSVSPRHSKGPVDGYYNLRTPKAHKEIDQRPGFVYRGMSWEEWGQIVRTGLIRSFGHHNLGQEGLTFYGDAETGEYYSNGFAPYSFKPGVRKPGVVIEIPARYVMDSTQNDEIPDGEFAHHDSLPSDVITRKWKIIPIRIKVGIVEVVVDKSTGKVSEGSRSSPSVAHAVVEF